MSRLHHRMPSKDRAEKRQNSVVSAPGTFFDLTPTGAEPSNLANLITEFDDQVTNAASAREDMFTREELQAEFSKLTALLQAEFQDVAGEVQRVVKEELKILCEEWRRRGCPDIARTPDRAGSRHSSNNTKCTESDQIKIDETIPFNGSSGNFESPVAELPGVLTSSPHTKSRHIKRLSRSGSSSSRDRRRLEGNANKDRLDAFSNITAIDDISDTVDTKETSRKVSLERSETQTVIINTHKRRISENDVAIRKSEGVVTQTEMQKRIQRLVGHPVFDYTVAALILLNGVMVGVQTDYLARELKETPPAAFQVIEIIFCFIFTTEVGIRLCAFRCGFFTRGGKGWNIFDLIIVTLQLVEIFLSAASNGLGFSFNLLRILRLIRVIRLARALRLIGELRTIVSSIVSSLKPLFWTGVLLLMVIYVLGVYITQVVLNKRITLETSGEHAPQALEVYWGSLVPSVFSLFESITGGVDWDDVVRPLIKHISPEMAVLYCMYIMFTCFAMLNVVTGVFIESVMKNAREENEQRTRNLIYRIFSTFDVEADGEISWQEFEQHLDKKEMREFFKTIDVDIQNARSLFDLLDVDETGALHFEEFMDGCLKIWSPSSGLDLRMIRRDLSKLSALVRDALLRKEAVRELS